MNWDFPEAPGGGGGGGGGGRRALSGSERQKDATVLALDVGLGARGTIEPGARDSALRSNCLRIMGAEPLRLHSLAPETMIFASMDAKTSTNWTNRRIIGSTSGLLHILLT